MLKNMVEVRLLVKGKPITEYLHQNEFYVEGRAGSAFEIEIKNFNAFRVEAVLSVDGLSITDGKAAGQHSSGYLVDANSTVRIPGWKLNAAAAAAFVFSGKSKAYVTATTGESLNTGVVGAMVFRDASYRPVVTPSYPIFNQFSLTSTSGGLNGGILRGVAYNNVAGSTSSAASVAPSATATAAVAKAQSTQQNLGTAFGQQTDFATTQVAFTRGALLDTLVFYYDDRKGLLSRGIAVSKRAAPQRNSVPQAFPAMNCTPPAGWVG